MVKKFHYAKITALLLALLLLASVSCADTRGEALTVTFFDVGKADAILIQSGESVVMIDTGWHSSGELLLGRLFELGVNSLDMLIITHFDKDHVGGADAILYNLPVGIVLEPGYQKESKQRDQYEDALEASGVSKLAVSQERQETVGALSFLIIPASDDDYGENQDNNASLVVRLMFGETGFLFAGDAEDDRLIELISRGSLECDVLKVPHHGRIGGYSEEFFEAVRPSAAVITSSDEEPEDEEVVSLLKSTSAQVYLTREGEVQIVCDGNNFTVSQGR